MTAYKNPILEIIERTKYNHAFMKTAKHEGVWEFTDLINSFLGILIFPKESVIADVDEEPICELTKKGISPEILLAESPINNNIQLIRMIRNGISHFNMYFLSEENVATGEDTISGLIIWNVTTSESKKCLKIQSPNFVCKFDIATIEKFWDYCSDIFATAAKKSSSELIPSKIEIYVKQHYKQTKIAKNSL